MEVLLLVACALLGGVIFMQAETIKDLKNKLDCARVFPEDKPVYVGLKPVKTPAKKPAKKKVAPVKVVIKKRARAGAK